MVHAVKNLVSKNTKHGNPNPNKPQVSKNIKHKTVCVFGIFGFCLDFVRIWGLCSQCVNNAMESNT